jgi:hypothetical protein
VLSFFNKLAVPSSCFLNKVIRLLHFNSFYCCMCYIYSCHKKQTETFTELLSLWKFFYKQNLTYKLAWQKTFAGPGSLNQKERQLTVTYVHCSGSYLVYGETRSFMSHVNHPSLLIPMTYANSSRNYLF